MITSEYLKRPYARRLIPDEGGGYVASIQEFPGLVAHGDTAEEALKNLENSAESWIEATLETGEAIPEPIDFYGYSGKIALRIPRGLHKRSAEMANAEGCSLNQWLTGAIALYLGGREAVHSAMDVVFKSYSLSITNNSTYYLQTSIPSVGEALTNSNLYSLGQMIPANTTGAGVLSYWTPEPHSGATIYVGDQDG